MITNISKGITVKTEILLCGRKVINGKRIQKRLVKTDNPDTIKLIYKANKHLYDYFVTYRVRVYLDDYGLVRNATALTWELYEE